MDLGIIEQPVNINPRADIDRQPPVSDIAHADILPSAGTCQFIADKPTPTDDCKCGRQAKSGSSYCLHHHAICWVTRDDDWSDTLKLE